MNKRIKGNENEQLACDYLKNNSFEIVYRNFTCRLGEIDIIGYDYEKEKKYLVFVEVKYRKSKTSGYAVEAVDYRKQQKICMVADYYRVIKHVHPATPVRFDVIAIEDQNIIWYKNAFSYLAR